MECDTTQRTLSHICRVSRWFFMNWLMFTGNLNLVTGGTGGGARCESRSVGDGEKLR